MRHRTSRPLVIATVAMTVAATLSMTGGAVSAAPPATSHGKTVTLVTGDRVTVLANGQLRVRPGIGREKVSFGTITAGQHKYVIPNDAMPMIAGGSLDRRLFDVPTLVADGYDDAHRSDLPLIVGHDRKTSFAGATVRRDLPALGMTAATASKTGTFWSSSDKSGATRIWLDGKRKVTLDQSVPQIGGPVAWAAGFTGKGTTTAILDTGIDATHPDFAGKISETKDFTDTTLDDKVGHGTHVASIITGSGAASNGKYKGVAPDTKLAIGKVCGDQYCEDSAILAGMTWAAQTVHADVVNMSLGGSDSPGIDPIEQAVDDLSASTHTLFVVAAGNDGCDGCVGSPGTAAAALTVGAVDKQDKLANFSSRGPRAEDDAIKPDLAAPGVGIVAARAKNGVIGTPADNPRYVSLDGTSMATPHVTGSAAILAGEHPDWTGQQIKTALMASAKTLDGIGVFSQGAGRVDIGRAVSQNLVASPPSVSVPTQLWPHNDDTPVDRQVSYHNYGKSPLLLTLSVEATSPGGQPAPDGTFALSTTNLTVPAGGDASVTVTTNTRGDAPIGEYTGRIVATSGDQTVGTPIAVNKEAEKYTLTVTGIDVHGRTPYAMVGVLADYNATEPGFFSPSAIETGKMTVRVPKGTYGFGMFLVGPKGSPDPSSVFAAPVVNLDHDITLHADARQAKPLDVTVDNPTARLSSAEVDAFFRTNALDVGVGSQGATLDGLRSASLGGAGPKDRFEAAVSTTFAEPGPNGDFVNSPYAYHLSDQRHGTMYDGFTQHVKTSRLAVVHNRQQKVSADPYTSRTGTAMFPDGTLTTAGLSFGQDTNPTADYVQYLTPGMRWLLYDVQGDFQQWTDGKLYQAGKHDETFFGGIMGPSVTDAIRSARVYPDRMIVPLEMMSDGDPHHGGIAAGATADSSVLYRNGVKIAERGADGLGYEGPSGEASFRLEAQLAQTAIPTSTDVRASWTFTTQKTTDYRGVFLPLFTLRFAADVDRARKGRFVLPVNLNWQVGASKPKVTLPTVEYSVDDGKTWRKALTVPAGDGRWVTVVDNPANGFVSLRTNAVDTAGNTSSATIIRAYAVK
ncbi:S8 family serine peptidase [Fodinicola acaciae]|uniref:S8 family serine peptidase n=1 Tax=Fodinicola acaciae TaxID=2681555 RepID=UPI0013D57A24|nr:S8 family serine peptidase [Fodinicola acaciae]